MSEQHSARGPQPEWQSAASEAERDHGARSDAYGRFYAPIAVVTLALSFMPLFEDVVVKDESGSITSTYGSLLDMAGRDGGGPAALGLMLFVAFAALLSIAAVRVKNPPLPASIAVIAGLMLLMLITKPGTGDPTPDLTGSGVAGGVLMFITIVIAGTHAVHITSRR